MTQAGTQRHENRVDIIYKSVGYIVRYLVVKIIPNLFFFNITDFIKVTNEIEFFSLSISRIFRCAPLEQNGGYLRLEEQYERKNVYINNIIKIQKTAIKS